jgi:hypothetical protein
VARSLFFRSVGCEEVLDTFAFKAFADYLFEVWLDPDGEPAGNRMTWFVGTRSHLVEQNTPSKNMPGHAGKLPPSCVGGKTPSDVFAMMLHCVSNVNLVRQPVGNGTVDCVSRASPR